MRESTRILVNITRLWKCNFENSMCHKKHEITSAFSSVIEQKRSNQAQNNLRIFASADCWLIFSSVNPSPNLMSNPRLREYTTSFWERSSKLKFDCVHSARFSPHGELIEVSIDGTGAIPGRRAYFLCTGVRASRSARFEVQ